jgi:acetate kinase
MILIINPGSTSVKFAIFCKERDSLNCVYRGTVDGIGCKVSFKVDCAVGAKCQNPSLKNIAVIGDSEDAFVFIMRWLVESDVVKSIIKVVYRVVHGGDLYAQSVEIDTVVFNNLELLVPFAPLHQPIALKAIKYFQLSLPLAQHFACFDTAFHQTMHKTGHVFALPKALREKGLKPYGFHGLSYQYISQHFTQLDLSPEPRRIVAAHLGGGASTCAIMNGLSLATSMTFSPLDGLPMATRCGSLDPSVVLFMIEQLQYSTNQVSDILNKRSGLLGLSGISGDVSVLCQLNSEEARFALNYYVSKICREIVVMTSELEGIDALVFTGGVGTNSSFIRASVCDKLKWLGIALDQGRNSTNQYIINNANSDVSVFVIKTDEELVMANAVVNEKGL